MNKQIRIDYSTGKTLYFPTHPKVKFWAFENEEEALLAQQMAIVAIEVDVNEFQHIFPAVLRMLKVKSRWAE